MESPEHDQQLKHCLHPQNQYQTQSDSNNTDWNILGKVSYFCEMWSNDVAENIIRSLEI